MANSGVAPPNFSTNVGLVRALIGDTDAINIDTGVGDYVWFSDADINAFLSVYSDNVKMAAARALYTIASSQALLLKKFSTDDLSVDGPAIAESLRKQAADLMAEASAEATNVDIFEQVHPVDYSDNSPIWTPDEPFGPEWYIDSDGYIHD